MIKKIAVLVTILFMTNASFSQGNGNQLVFNKVIDTTVMVSITSCFYLPTAGYYGSLVTIPSNRIWKIESLGPLEWGGSSSLYANCSGSGSVANVIIWGIMANDNSSEFYMARRYYNGTAWVDESTRGISWLRGGTSLSARISSNTPTNRNTNDASPTNPLYCKIGITALEFILKPITP